MPKVQFNCFWCVLTILISVLSNFIKDNWVIFMKISANFCDFFWIFAEIFWFCFLLLFSILAFDRNFSRGFNGIYLELFQWQILLTFLNLFTFFLINFIGVIFEAGNETRKKIWSDFCAEQIWRVERKKSGFCSFSCFWESKKLMSEKTFSKRANFFVTCSFKCSFFQLLIVMMFDYDIVLVLGLFW